MARCFSPWAANKVETVHDFESAQEDARPDARPFAADVQQPEGTIREIYVGMAAVEK